MYASVLGNLKLVCMLMKYEANVDLMNSQEETALMCACSAGNAKVSKMLMLLSASHTIQFKKGWISAPTYCSLQEPCRCNRDTT